MSDKIENKNEENIFEDDIHKPEEKLSITEDKINSNNNDDKTPQVSQDELEKIIEDAKSDEKLSSLESAIASEDAEYEAEVKTKRKPVKLNKFFTRKFSEGQFKRKVLKHIFIPNDKKFVQEHFQKIEEEKNGKIKTYFVLTEKQLPRKEVLKLNRIAKDIKKQKGRINFLPLIAAITAVVLVLVFAFFFRNIISRKIVVSASEAAFGAKCDIEFVDFNLFKTRFQIKGYAVANKNAPMKNLFEIKNIDLYFNLLELSRGKFVCENIAIDGITWNTNRKTSGALPKKPKKEKDENSILNNNPLMKMINAELEMIKSGVSISDGFQAVREQTDPRLILERNLNAFQSPKIKDEILNFAPSFIESWKEQVAKTETDVKEMIAEGQKFANTNFQEIDSPEQIKDLIKQIISLTKSSKQKIENVKLLSNKIQDDAQKIETLGKNIEGYIVSDMNHVKNIAAKIKDIKVKGAGGFVSDLFRVFYLETLGTYYPRFMELVAMANQAQTSPKKEKKPTLADKSKSLERLAGRNFLFSDHSAPTLLFKNIQLSTHSPDKNFTLAGDVQNITNDANKLNKPISFALSSSQKQFAEHVNGTVDLRTGTPNFINVGGDFSGLDLDLDAKITGLPKLTGAFETYAEVEIGKNNDLRILTKGIVKNASLQIAPFEPAILSRIYGDVLARINTVDLSTELFKATDSAPKLKVLTSVDEQIFASIQQQLLIEIARIRELVIAEGKKYLEKIRAEYLPQIESSDKIIATVKLALTDSKKFEEMLKSKLQEAEARLKQIATEKAREATNEIKEQIDDTTDKIKDQIKDTFSLPFGP
ncbi:MAG: TIGR03545 family protein [Treponemataceae bacterium]